MSADDEDENIMKLVFYNEISVRNYLIVLAKLNLIFEQKQIYIHAMNGMHIKIQAKSGIEIGILYT